MLFLMLIKHILPVNDVNRFNKKVCLFIFNLFNIRHQMTTKRLKINFYLLRTFFLGSFCVVSSFTIQFLCCFFFHYSIFVLFLLSLFNFCVVSSFTISIWPKRSERRNNTKTTKMRKKVRNK